MFLFHPHFKGRYSNLTIFSDDCWNDQLGNLGFLDNSEQRCSKLPHFFGGWRFSCVFFFQARKEEISREASRVSRVSFEGATWWQMGLIGSKTGQSGIVFLGSFGGLVQHVVFFSCFFYGFFFGFWRNTFGSFNFVGDRWFSFAHCFSLSICHLAEWNYALCFEQDEQISLRIKDDKFKIPALIWFPESLGVEVGLIVELVLYIIKH